MPEGQPFDAIYHSQLRRLGHAPPLAILVGAHQCQGHNPSIPFVVGTFASREEALAAMRPCWLSLVHDGVAEADLGALPIEKQAEITADWADIQQSGIVAFSDGHSTEVYAVVDWVGVDDRTEAPEVPEEERTEHDRIAGEFLRSAMSVLATACDEIPQARGTPIQRVEKWARVLHGLMIASEGIAKAIGVLSKGIDEGG